MFADFDWAGITDYFVSDWGNQTILRCKHQNHQKWQHKKVCMHGKYYFEFIVTSRNVVTRNVDALAGLPQREWPWSDSVHSVLIAAARLTADARKFYHVTPLSLFMNLQWLRVCLNASSVNFAF